MCSRIKCLSTVEILLLYKALKVNEVMYTDLDIFGFCLFYRS